MIFLAIYLIVGFILTSNGYRKSSQEDDIEVHSPVIFIMACVFWLPLLILVWITCAVEWWMNFIGEKHGDQE